MRIGGLIHAALLVTDLERAREFYGRVLGLKEKARPAFNFPGAWYDLGEAELHLMVTSGPLPAPGARPRRDYHIAFQVDDLDEARRALEIAGLVFRESSSGLPSIFVRDPDGNLIELQQRN
jgi:catechol 2,3-dioxygenase-like lactoylglutathione lyase family enzyme